MSEEKRKTSFAKQAAMQLVAGGSAGNNTFFAN